MARKSENGGNFREAYLALRRNIGRLAVALPVIVVLGMWLLSPSGGIQSSISAYYHTVMRDVFVGVMFAIGIFLFNYNPGIYDPGYKEVADQRAGRAAGTFAIVLALFPTWRENWASIIPPGIHYNENLFGTIHVAAAVLFFLTLTYFCYFLFTKTKPGKEVKKGGKKARRNNTYKISAWIMFVSILLMGAYVIYSMGLGAGDVDLYAQYSPVFFLEFVALWAFGVAWFVKGEALAYFND